jgi:Fe-S oxidoreductase
MNEFLLSAQQSIAKLPDEIREIIAGCQQCGSCTASCPVSEVTEFNIRKLVHATELGLALDEKELSSLPWQCTLCGRCDAQCQEQLKVTELVWYLRQKAIEEDLSLKSRLDKLVSQITATNAPFTVRDRKKDSWCKDIASPARDSDTLLWAGCVPALLLPEIPRAALSLLRGLSIKVICLGEDEPCCGEPLIVMGETNQARKIAHQCFERLLASQATKVVTTCAGCYWAFKFFYPRRLGIDTTQMEILHMSELLGRVLTENDYGQISQDEPPSDSTNGQRPRVFYHAPCSLAREARICQQPRQLLEMTKQFQLVEPQLKPELTTCCGGGGGLWRNNPTMALQMAKSKLLREVLPLQPKLLVTTCPLCNIAFTRAAKRLGLNLEVTDLCVLLERYLKKGN